MTGPIKSQRLEARTDEPSSTSTPKKRGKLRTAFNWTIGSLALAAGIIGAGYGIGEGINQLQRRDNPVTQEYNGIIHSPDYHVEIRETKGGKNPEVKIFMKAIDKTTDPQEVTGHDLDPRFMGDKDWEKVFITGTNVNGWMDYTENAPGFKSWKYGSQDNTPKDILEEGFYDAKVLLDRARTQILSSEHRGEKVKDSVDYKVRIRKERTEKREKEAIEAKVKIAEEKAEAEKAKLETTKSIETKPIVPTPTKTAPVLPVPTESKQNYTPTQPEYFPKSGDNKSQSPISPITPSPLEAQVQTLLPTIPNQESILVTPQLSEPILREDTSKKPSGALDKSFSERNDFRTRIDFDSNGYQRWVFGVAPEGSYNENPTSMKGQFFETFRIYNTPDFTAGGFIVPEFNLGDIKTKAIIYSAIDSNTNELGLGLETHNQLSEDLKANWVVENYGKKSRLGGGINYKLTDTLDFGIGIDGFEEDLETQQIIANVLFDPTKEDTFGLGYVSDTTNHQAVAGFYSKHNSNWGLRTHFRYDQNKDLETKSFSTGTLFTTDSPNTGRLGATWIVGRTVWEDGMFNNSQLPLSVLKVEAPGLPERANSGWSLGVFTGHNESPTSESSYISEAAAFTISPGTGAYLGMNHTLGDNNIDTHSINTGFLYRTPDNNGHGITLDLGLDFPVSGDKDFTYRLGGEWRF
jgi:hypothetical protein